MDVLDASSRVALAALIHDLGKLAQRAGLPFPTEKKETHIQLYCPHHEEGNWWSHHHAYTALAFDAIEQNAPALIRGEMAPFASRDAGEGEITDSLVNAAAKHHRPETLMQWIIATADRIASGFEREEFEKYNDNGGSQEERGDTGKNHFQARQLTLFEQIRLADTAEPLTPGSMQWCYPLKPLSPESLFPMKRAGYEPDNNAAAKKEYTELWDDFQKGLEKIPVSHRQAWPLWLDHFDTAWLTYTHAVPSATAFGTRPDVSLYDHSKATAALAVALWRYHLRHPCDEDEAVRKMADRTDWDTAKFLLIQGDFFGIQDFIFAEGRQTNRQAAKLLRGRSFYVSLLMELAALKILEALALPSTSQIINAAGKFLIVAENSPETEERLKRVREELNQWFLENTYGVAGIGLVWRAAGSNDFLKGKPSGKQSASGFAGLMEKLFRDLEVAKLQQFSLCGQASPVLPGEFSKPCQWQGNLPVDGKEDGESCALSRDQIKIGEHLTRKDWRILVLKAEDGAAIRTDNLALCELPVFGYRIAFTGDEQQSGRFAELVSNGVLRRCWDYSLPENMHDVLWQGYARRNINGYVPRFGEKDVQEEGKYAGAADEADAVLPEGGGIKPFGHIACEDRQQLADGKWAGQVALTTLKGDVDNLGNIFRRGLNNPERNQHYSFARMAALSRQMNSFFAVWLPARCEEAYANTYTVFAGGDDFFMIGPWRSTQKLAGEIAARFRAYTAENPEIHLSAGMVMTKPGYPVHALAEAAEEALSEAKRHDGKNAAHLFKETVSWHDWARLEGAEDRIDALAEDYALSTGYLYSLFSLIDLAESEVGETKRPEASLWRSKLAYRTARMLEANRKIAPEARRNAHVAMVTDIGEKGIAAFRGAYRIPLFNHFYRKR